VPFSGLCDKLNRQYLIIRADEVFSFQATK